MRSYYKVTAINGDQITVADQNDNTINVSKNILEKMVSGDHFEKELSMNKTELAEFLETLSDNVFTICFHKQPTVDSGIEVFKNVDIKDLSDQKKVNELVKKLTTGSECTMVCYLVDAENNLGRSTVIDLNAHGNKFR